MVLELRLVGGLLDLKRPRSRGLGGPVKDLAFVGRGLPCREHPGSRPVAGNRRGLNSTQVANLEPLKGLTALGELTIALHGAGERRCLSWATSMPSPAADAHIRPQPGRQGHGEPWVCLPEFLGRGRGLGAFDDLVVVVADELDGAGGISLGNSVHNESE